MKIIKLKHSFLFMVLHPENDTVRCYFHFFTGFWFWNTKKENQVFDLNEIPLSLVKEVYKKLANDWDRKYRI